MARRRPTLPPSNSAILVVDDELEVLTSTRALLERDGHHVLTARSGQEALALFRPGHIQLLIIDYFMPRMSGEELIWAIREQDQDVQILLQTGYAGERPPHEMFRSLDIQGYHDKADGPDHLRLWVDAALKASAQLQRVRETEQLKVQLLLKEEILANLCHEMRTPLHIISGYIEMMLDEATGPLTPETHHGIDRIQRQTHLLKSLVNDFLDVARTEVEAMVVTPQSISLASLQPEIENLMRSLVRKKTVSFAWEVSPQLPPVQADRQKLFLILRNLLSNAVKFTEQGTVRVIGALTESGKGVALQVRDTGVGIAPEQHRVIFDLFRQADGSSSRRFGGAGIGLALARRLARLMGGEIAVDSIFGAGSTFTLTLKTAPHPPQPVQTPALSPEQPAPLPPAQSLPPSSAYQKPASLSEQEGA